MMPIVNELKTTYGNSIDFQIINYYSAEGQTKARLYRAPGHPTFVTLDKTGTVKRTMPGVLSKAQLESALKELLAGH